MRKFSWHTIPVKLTDLSTVYQYAVDRFIPLDVDRHGFGSYIHVKAGTFVTQHDGGWQRYKPNRKGGHTHNHIKNMELRLMLTKKEIKAIRKIMKREKEMNYRDVACPNCGTVYAVGYSDVPHSVENIHRICNTCMMPVEVKNPWNEKD